MAALSARRLMPDTKHIDPGEGGFVIPYDVDASTIIYEGAFVRLGASGNIVPCGGSSTNQCLGIAIETVDNSGGSGGDKTCRVLVGAIIDHAVASTDKNNIGSDVYASDDQTLTRTVGSNEFVGFILGITGTNKALIRMAWPGQPA